MTFASQNSRMDGIPRILAGVPSYSGPDPRAFMNFLVFSQRTGKAEQQGLYKLRWTVAPKMRIDQARNDFCAFSLAGKCTHLLLIDDDMMIINTDILPALLEDDRPIISPIFFRRGLDGQEEPLAFGIDPEGEPIPFDVYPVDRLFEAPGGVGSGMMLIKTEVLRAMEPPWFYFPESGARGMDVHFCRRAREKGFSAWCDSRYLVPQLGPPEEIGHAGWQRRRNGKEAG